MLQQLSDDYDSGEDSDYPSDSASDSESDTHESIGIESTDDESESSGSGHSSDEGFLDDDSED